MGKYISDGSLNIFVQLEKSPEHGKRVFKTFPRNCDDFYFILFLLELNRKGRGYQRQGAHGKGVIYKDTHWRQNDKNARTESGEVGGGGIEGTVE
jgi:hypothetical protein